MSAKFFSFGSCVLGSVLAVFALVACSSEGGDAGAGSSGSSGVGAGGSAGATMPASSSSASSASSSSSTGAGGGESAGTLSIIDDMEDGDGAIAATDGRQGYWYSYNDGTGMQTPAAMKPFTMSPLATPRGDSKYAAHTKGSGFTQWGAGMGLDLNNNGTVKAPYDASAYKGITFWAMSGTATPAEVRVNLGDKDTVPEGKICNDASGKCNDHFGKSISVGSEWQQISIPFDQLRQQGFGDPAAAFDPGSLYVIQLQVGANVAFDLWIDDIAFFK